MTAQLVAEEGGFTYHADSYSDDLPYYESVRGTGARPQLVVPYTFDVNDQVRCMGIVQKSRNESYVSHLSANGCVEWS